MLCLIRCCFCCESVLSELLSMSLQGTDELRETWVCGIVFLGRWILSAEDSWQDVELCDPVEFHRSFCFHPPHPTSFCHIFFFGP